jgi:hypothetical protein
MNRLDDEDDFSPEQKPKGKLPKLPDNVKRVFTEYDQKFYNGVDRLRKKFPLRANFQPELLTFGANLDKELWNRHGLTKKYYGRKSFRRRAWLYNGAMITETSKEGIVLRKIEAGGVASENLTAELLFGESKKFKVSGDLRIRMDGKRIVNADTWDTLDVLAHKITQMWIEDLKKQGIVPLREEFSEGELQFFLSQTEIPTFVVISFEEHKRLLGQMASSSRARVTKQIKSVGNLHYEGNLSFPTKDHGRVSFYVNGSFADIYIPEDEESWDWVRSSPQFAAQAEKLEKGGGYIINLTGHIWGMLFFLNTLNRNIRMLPQRFYKELSASAKLLFRLTLVKAQGRVDLNQIVKVMGWDPEVTREGLRLRLKEVQETWIELVEHGFIKETPVPVAEEGILVWHYERVPKWFDDQKTLGV